MRPSGSSHACAGQALLESLVIMLALGGIFMVIPWLGRLQDIALQSAHASRFAAFSLTRDPALRPLSQIIRHFFSGPSHQWARSNGTRLISDGSQVRLSVSALSDLDVAAHPGGVDQEASALRHGLRIDEWGILMAQTGVSISNQMALPGRVRPAWLAPYPSLDRGVAILVDAAHASDDVSAQRRVARSGPGWADMAQTSYSLGRRTAIVSGPVDESWGRDAPLFDWLEPWAGRLPAYHLGGTGDAP
ncbi:MAG TPA: hypothetical protein VFR20_11450 [Burkholderiaceae bacterium]|nr:hypothetical protein [Burkholderiaceae bacterium]